MVNTHFLKSIKLLREVASLFPTRLFEGIVALLRSMPKAGNLGFKCMAAVRYNSYLSLAP